MSIRKQKGFALIQVMLVFAILIVVAAKLQYEQRIQIERTAQSLFLSQAQVYIESSEAITEVGLVLDIKNTETDHLYELWNITEGMFPIEGGVIELDLNDLQGRFNINWLSMESTFRAEALQSFKRLLLIIDTKPGIADELYLWFDQESGIDYQYQDQVPSYAPSYTLMADTSELLLLSAVELKDYKIIKPFLSALPADSELNINTAPVEIIQSIAVFIDEGTANNKVSERGEEGFKNVSDFTTGELFKTNKDKPMLIPNLTVLSSWFELYTSVTVNDQVLKQRSILYRDSNEAKIVMRDRSVTEKNPIPGDPIKGIEDSEATDADLAEMENQ